jgi:trehalose 6-phosphate synthase
MRLTSRLSTSLICSVAAVSLILAYYQTRADTRSLHHELERHALVLAESVAKSAEPLVQSKSDAELQNLVDRFKDREQTRLDRVPQPIVQSLGDGLTHAAFLWLAGDPVHIVALPLRHDAQVIGILSIFHDTAYINAQAAALWRRALIGVAIQTLLIGCITLLTIRWGLGRPLARMTQWLHELRTGAATAGDKITERGEFEPLTEEVTRLASSLVAARAAAEEEARLRETAESNWTAERLRIFVQTRLGGDRLFAVSNREPYEHVRRPEGIQCVVPARGLPGSRRPPAMRITKWWTKWAACGFRRTIPNTRCAGYGSRRRKNGGSTWASPTRVFGRCATSRIRGPPFARTIGKRIKP